MTQLNCESQFKGQFDEAGLTNYMCEFDDRWYILCPDCIPVSDVCGVKEWHDRDGTNNYDFDEECWIEEE